MSNEEKPGQEKERTTRSLVLGRTISNGEIYDVIEELKAEEFMKMHEAGVEGNSDLATKHAIRLRALIELGSMFFSMVTRNSEK